MKNIKNAYYAIHPSHSHLSESWFKEDNGTVWLTVHSQCDRELFFNRDDKLVEIEWIYSNIWPTTIGSITVNGRLSFDGLSEYWEGK